MSYTTWQTSWGLVIRSLTILHTPCIRQHWSSSAQLFPTKLWPTSSLTGCSLIPVLYLGSTASLTSTTQVELKKMTIFFFLVWVKSSNYDTAVLRPGRAHLHRVLHFVLRAVHAVVTPRHSVRFWSSCGYAFFMLLTHRIGLLAWPVSLVVRDPDC